MFQQDFFEKISKKYPSKIALDDHGDKFSYKFLNEKANQIANALYDLKTNHNERICILTKKNFNLYTSILGILKSGNCWVPLNEQFPKERISHIIKSTNCKILLIEKEFLNLIKKNLLKKIKVLLVDKKTHKMNKNFLSQKNLEKYSKKFVKHVNINSSDLAYIIFTSGSTGDPKGVTVSHLNTHTFIKNTKKYFKIKKGLRFAHTSEIIFDPSIFDIFVCWLNVGTVVPVNRKEYKVNFLNFFKKNKNINVCFLVPSYFQSLKELNHLESKFIKNLKHLIFTGEALSKNLVKSIYKTNPNINIYNCYGTTETAIISHWIKYSKKDLNKKLLPVGKEIPDVKTILVNSKNKIAKINEKGTAYAYGTQISPGYWDNKFLNQKYFIDDPVGQIKHQKVYKTGDILFKDKNNFFYYCGRDDSQIKIRGHRIEIGEIENTLKFKSDCNDLVVMPFTKVENLSYKNLVYFIKSNTLEKNKNYFLDLARKFLPTFMQPTEIIILKNDIPRNINGKIDKKKLEKLYFASTND